MMKSKGFDLILMLSCFLFGSALLSSFAVKLRFDLLIVIWIRLGYTLTSSSIF